MLKICIATSTRADWGLLHPLASALKAHPDVSLSILATNMHLLERYGHTVDDIIADGFDVTERVDMPDTDDSEAGKVMAMAKCMEGTALALSRISPDILVVLGDRYEMLSVASAACVMKIPVAHIAGGEISEGAIDDNIRHAITKLSALHFCETQEYAARVVQMGEQPERVVNAGALGVWNILHQPLMQAQELSEHLGFQVEPRKVLMVTLHPSTLADASGPSQYAVCRNLTDALSRFPDYHVVISYPNNDAGSEGIIRRINEYAAECPERVHLFKSLGMRVYLSLLRYAAAVVGNSSSGIIEVPSMGIPSVDIGIRQQGRLAADSVIHCSESAEDIYQAIRHALSPQMAAMAAACHNPYAKPDTVDIIVDRLVNANTASLVKKKFHNVIYS